MRVITRIRQLGFRTVRKRRLDELQPRKNPAQARSRAVVNILEAAARGFARKGYAAATTNHIAETAGVSVGSLYEYFPNQHALLVALMESHIEESRSVLSAAAEAALQEGMALPDSVGILVHAMIGLHARDRALHRVLFEETPLPPRIRRQLEAVEAAMALRVADHLERHPDVRTDNPALAARILVQTVEGLTHRLVIHGSTVDDPGHVREIVTLCVAYLTSGSRGG